MFNPELKRMYWFWCFLVCLVACGGESVSRCKDEFPCDDGFCIRKQLWCDAEIDCPDGSDEKYCFLSSNLRPNPNGCGETFFLCKDGPCIPLVGRCDGFRSCHDNSDEAECEPQRTNYTLVPSTTKEIYELNATELPTTLHFGISSREVLKHVHDEVVNDVNSVQSENKSKEQQSQDKNLEKGYEDLEPRSYRRERSFARDWLLKSRDDNFGWGEETHRALIALYMSDDGSLLKQHEKMLMSKNLHLKLFTALIRNMTKTMSIGDLSLFINALSASCDNPRNFYGQNLVDILRERTNSDQEKSKFISPLVYLTLCVNNVMTYTDARKVQEILYGTPDIEIGIEALVSLTATCFSRIAKFKGNSMGQQVANRLYNKIAQQGLPENIYQLSLVSQALNEARINQDLWNRSKALQNIVDNQQEDGSFGDILSTYYSMPILSGGSLLSLRQHCERHKETDLTPMEVLKNGDDAEVYVSYSLYFGSPVEVSQSLMIKVKRSTNFLDIMRIAETTNPVYKFKYDMSIGRPTVYSIGGVVNDPERGLYWKLHVNSLQNSTDVKNLAPFEGDIRSFVPESGQFMVFWLKEMF